MFGVDMDDYDEDWDEWKAMIKKQEEEEGQDNE